MIGVVIPAHNEEAGIAACLHSVQAAARHAAVAGEDVVIVVALDRCSDRTAEIVAAFGVHSVVLHEGNVGLARAAGAALVIGLGARWVACTDADSRVPQDWLACQIACDADAFCGIVTVDDWLDYDDTMRLHFGTPEAQRDGHPHVHGANMGFSASMYLRSGGFPALPAHEDVAMVDALHRAGARIARRATPVVITSARRVARAQGGFADYLLALEARTRLLAAPLLPDLDLDLGSDAHAA